MYALDFEYDGRRLSDYGFILCTFGGGTSGIDTVSAGSKITFSTVSRWRGKANSLIGTKYDERVSASFTICKNTDEFDDLHISDDEYRSLCRWLNRHEFLEFAIIDDEAPDRATRYYNASFNINKLMVNKELFGLELSMETDSPFAHGAEVSDSWTVSDTETVHNFTDTSDEIGYICPSMKITCIEGGTLTVSNDITGSSMVIKNCTAGEVITIDGDAQIVQSSLNSHHVYDDFNFEFFRIGNTSSNRVNKITVSLKCSIEMSYRPIIKDSPD